MLLSEKQEYYTRNYSLNATQYRLVTARCIYCINVVMAHRYEHHVNGPELIVRYNYQIDDSNTRTLTFMLKRHVSRLA